MTTTERLDFQLEEPGDDALSDKVFDVLTRLLQPDSRLSMEDGVQQITALLPEGHPYTSEVGRMLMTCYEVAEQIPYNHASMVKLVTVLDLCLTSSHFYTEKEEMSIARYQKLGETLRDWWDSSSPAEDPSKFVNFQTFVARAHERGMLKGPILAIWTLQAAFDEKNATSSEVRDAYAKAATQLLLIEGNAIYGEVMEGRLALREWQRWHKQLSDAAAGKASGKSMVYSQDTVTLAEQATVAMEAVERMKTG